MIDLRSVPLIASESKEKKLLKATKLAFPNLNANRIVKELKSRLKSASDQAEYHITMWSCKFLVCIIKKKAKDGRKVCFRCLFERCGRDR